MGAGKFLAYLVEDINQDDSMLLLDQKILNQTRITLC
jgi:hypothetical protein